MKRIVNAFTDHAVYLIDNAERLAIVIVSRIAPWAAPLAPAYLVARATADHFRAPIAVAVAVAVTVEAVGIASTHITMEMHQYNQTRRKSDPEAPFSVGMLASISYFFIGITLTVLLELFPEMIIVAPAAFFLLAVVAYITLALMSGHARRLEAIRQQKEQRTVPRQRNKSGTEPEPGTGPWGGSTRQRAMEILTERPDISGSALGRELNRSAGFGRRLKRELEPELNGRMTQ